MSTVATLMDTAVADVELLRVLDADGDDFSIPRDVEFLLRGSSAEKASIVASFVNDHQYGRASLDQSTHRGSVQSTDDGKAAMSNARGRREDRYQHAIRHLEPYELGRPRTCKRHHARTEWHDSFA